MKISFARTGGFAGLHIGLDLDTQNLPADQAAGLEKLVRQADFFQQPDIPQNRQAADGFHYSITVDGDGQKRTIEVGDSSVPTSLQPLVNELFARARGR